MSDYKKETVTIMSVSLKKQDDRYTIWNVQLAPDQRFPQGRIAASFDKEEELRAKVNIPTEVYIEQGEYQGVSQYTLRLNPPQSRSGGGFNLSFNQKRTALECAVKGGSLEDDETILARADKFLSWLKA